jgi:hypothetical protein
VLYFSRECIPEMACETETQGRALPGARLLTYMLQCWVSKCVDMGHTHLAEMAFLITPASLNQPCSNTASLVQAMVGVSSHGPHAVGFDCIGVALLSLYNSPTLMKIHRKSTSHTVKSPLPCTTGACNYCRESIGHE